MKSTLTYQTVWRRLSKIYGEGEAKALVRMVYELRYGLTLSDLYVGRDVEVPQDELEDVVCRLEQHEPIQYIIGVAEFCGRRFMVDRRVLIPRPETEELCGWVLSEKSSLEQLTGGCSILDVGTGSGCIAITLAAGIPQAKVTAWDLSDGALQVARMNAKRICVDVSFVQMDALNILQSNRLDGIEQYIQSLILFRNVDVSAEDVEKLSAMGAIKFKDVDPSTPGDVRYLTAELNQEGAQTLKEDLYKSLLIICGMPNRNTGNG